MFAGGIDSGFGLPILYKNYSSASDHYYLDLGDNVGTPCANLSSDGTMKNYQACAASLSQRFHQQFQVVEMRTSFLWLIPMHRYYIAEK